MNTAIMVEGLVGRLENGTPSRTEPDVYQLVPPIDGPAGPITYVIVSMGWGETTLFACDSGGVMTSRDEIGSIKGMNVAYALLEAGYVVATTATN